MRVESISFVPADGSQAVELAAVWTAACGADLALSPRFFQQNFQLSETIRLYGQAVIQDQTWIGFAIGSLVNHPAGAGEGWVEALAVTPPHQRQGIGGQLLYTVERWLQEQGCQRIHFGGGWRHFTPGLPVELPTTDFLKKRGYIVEGKNFYTWDLARGLLDYVSPPSLKGLGIEASAAKPGDESALLAFLEREFPGRWHFECQEYLAAGGSISKYILLHTPRGVDGFCRLTLEGSSSPIDRYYPNRLPRPWAQLGSVGVSADCRGKGYGLAVVDSGLRRLQSLGVNGCVIDWSGLLDFYAKFGFQHYRQYQMLAKEVPRGG